MTTYTDVFGGNTVPASESSYVAVTLTATTQFYWPEHAVGSYLLYDSMAVTATAGSLALKIDAANVVSVGRGIIFRNVGSNAFDVSDTSGNVITNVAAGISKYVQLTDNSTANGSWSALTYGAGTSTATASDLDGAGLTVVGAELAGNMPTSNITSGYVISSTDRAYLLRYVGGTATLTLPTPTSGFYFYITNQGSGTLTLSGGGNNIDGSASKDLQPLESILCAANGTIWSSIGYGRSSTFSFTQLSVDVSAGTPITITSAQAANKLWYFYNVTAADITVTIPAVGSVYFLRVGGIGAKTLTFTTGAGATVGLTANQSYIIYCDGTNVTAAQTVAVTSTLQLSDGSAASPSGAFATDTDTGFYRYGANSLGFAAGGVTTGHAGSTEWYFALPLNFDSGVKNTTLSNLSASLAAIAGLSGTGFLTQTGAGTYAQRAITGTANEVTVTNGDGIAGVPTLSLPTALTFTGKTVTGGDFQNSTANTQTLGDSSTKLATTAFVAGTAFSSALPAQLGNSGKLLTTDGTNASWATLSSLGGLTAASIGVTIQAHSANLDGWSAIATSTKQATLVSGTNLKTVNGTTLLGSGDLVIVSNGLGGTTASGSVTLTSASSAVQAVTPSALGQSITLPDATTCNKGVPLFHVTNKGSYYYGVRDSAGTLVSVIGPGGSATIGLADNSTAAGNWAVSGSNLCHALPIVDRQQISASAVQTPFAYQGDNVIVLSSTLVVYAGYIGTTLYLAAHDLSTNTIGTTVTVASAAANIGSNGFFCGFKVSATSGVVFSGASGGTTVYGLAFSVSGTTITTGSAATATVTTIGFADYRRAHGYVCQLSSTSYVMGGNTGAQPKAIAASVSGTTVTFGSETNIGAATGTSHFLAMLYRSATQAILVMNDTGGYALPIRHITVSGTTITNNSDATPATYAGLNATTEISNVVSVATDEWWVVGRNSADTQFRGYRITVSGTTVSCAANDFSALSTGTIRFAGYSYIERAKPLAKLSSTTALLATAPNGQSPGAAIVSWGGATFSATSGASLGNFGASYTSTDSCGFVSVGTPTFIQVAAAGTYSGSADYAVSLASPPTVSKISGGSPYLGGKTLCAFVGSKAHYLGAGQGARPFGIVTLDSASLSEISRTSFNQMQGNAGSADANPPALAGAKLVFIAGGVANSGYPNWYTHVVELCA